ncbi:MAG TPA: zinc ribbon domain-containing protein [Clostridiaceae bacterium]|nr:zinc ribbon domain-containing protein [Clostridiaceae bacterium]
MKVLIWFLTILVATILNTLLGYATGFKAGYFVFYIAVFFVARKLCNLWDKHTEAKNEDAIAQPSNMIQNEPTPFTFPSNPDEIPIKGMAPAADMPPIKFCRKCGHELLDDSDFCSNCGTRVISTVSHNFCQSELQIDTEKRWR